MIRIFIGYDPRESAAYHVCSSSLIRNASQPLSITPLHLPHLIGYDDMQPRDGSNAFTYSRFLIPALCDYSGWALWLDGDMIARADIAELWAMRDPYKAIQCVQHPPYRTKHPVKYLGARNNDYERKNWSSVMLINCAHYHNRLLTPDYVRAHDGAHLHRLSWITERDRLGDLPREWNWLVEEYPHNDAAKLLHYTIGTPCFSGYANCDHADVWHQERAIMLSCEEHAEEAA